MGYYRNEKIVKKGFSYYELCGKSLYLFEGGEYYCDVCDTNGECEGGYIPMYPKSDVNYFYFTF